MTRKRLQIEFYKSALCPRCMFVGRVLTKIQEENPHLEVARIDIVTHPLAAWENGIRMVPALKAGGKVLSGVFLSGKKIREFVDEAPSKVPGAK